MEPLVSSGDWIMVDVSRNLPSPPGIFVIWDGLGLVAKRIEHVPSGILPAGQAPRFVVREPVSAPTRRRREAPLE